MVKLFKLLKKDSIAVRIRNMKKAYKKSRTTEDKVSNINQLRFYLYRKEDRVLEFIASCLREKDPAIRKAVVGVLAESVNGRSETDKFVKKLHLAGELTAVEYQYIVDYQKKNEPAFPQLSEFQMDRVRKQVIADIEKKQGILCSKCNQGIDATENQVTVLFVGQGINRKELYHTACFTPKVRNQKIQEVNSMQFQYENGFYLQYGPNSSPGTAFFLNISGPEKSESIPGNGAQSVRPFG